MNIFNRIIDYFRTMMERQNRKKLIENLLIVIIAGIIILIAGGSFFGGERKDTRVPAKQQEEAVSKVFGSEDKLELEKKMETILSQIEGVGKVNVMVTFVSGKEMVPAFDSKKNESDTQEKDNGGGTRSIKQNDTETRVVFEERQGGIRKPIILKEMQPSVKGVVVVAEGASDVRVRESLSKAVQVLLDVPIHKIQVFERNK